MVAGVNPATMYLNSIAPWEQYPKHLSFSQVVSPKKVIMEFFSSGWPKDHRKGLKKWRYYVLNDLSYKDRHGAGHLLFVYDQTLELIEAMHLLLLENRDRWPRLEDVTEEQIAQEKESWVYFPGNLSPEELANPYRAVKKCFKKISPQQYRIYLHEWLGNALYKRAADETNLAADIITVYSNIRRLYSAAWLIHQRETNQTITQQSWGQGKAEKETVEKGAEEESTIAKFTPLKDISPELTQSQEVGLDEVKRLILTGETLSQQSREQGGGKEETVETAAKRVNTEELTPLKDIVPKLTRAQELGLNEVKNLIVQKIPSVRLIYLLGTHSDPFTYYLVVLIDDKEKTPEHEIANKIEDFCRYLTSVFAIVHKLSSAKEALVKGKRFWNKMLYGSICIYDSTGAEFPDFIDIKDEVWLERAAQDWNRWGMQGKAFLKGAVRYIEDEDYNLALFCLNQAAESSLIAIIRAVLGYRLSAHNLSRMIKITLLFTDEIRNVLQLDSGKGTQLFQLLQNGYSEARYKNEFKPDEKKVKQLKEKASQLLVTVEQVYQQFRNSKRATD